MNITERYKDYSPKVQEYMKCVINSLNQDYGDGWPDSWLISLDTLADHLFLYTEAIADIREKGTSHVNREGRQVKNPNITVLSNAMGAIRDIIKSFAFSPTSRQKLELLNKVDSDTVVDNYVASLTQ